jgi:rubrerythrin
MRRKPVARPGWNLSPWRSAAFGVTVRVTRERQYAADKLRKSLHFELWRHKRRAFSQLLGETSSMNGPAPETARLPEFRVGRRALLVGGATLGATITASPRTTTTAASVSEEDVRALNVLLLVEHVQVAFYAEALRRAALGSELSGYARQVASQEEDHLAFLKQALGSEAVSKPAFEFGDATRRRDAFVAAATEVEDLAVGAYNGLGATVSREVLAGAAKIVSVEARHAAWIRSIVGQLPAANATDKALSADEVLDGLSRLGLRR